MAASAEFNASVTGLVESRLAVIRALTYTEAAALPESEGEDVRVGGVNASMTVFRQVNAYKLEGRVLVVVQVARPRLLGMMSQHIERGLVFSPTEPVREATKLELQKSGG